MDKKEIDFQRKCDKFWYNQCAWCQTSLVEHLFGQEVEGFSHEDVENLECKDDDGYEDFHEILEWWLIDDHLANYLRKRNEPILDNDYGIWWGRCTSGQAVSMDSVIEDIVLGFEKEQAQRKKLHDARREG